MAGRFVLESINWFFCTAVSRVSSGFGRVRDGNGAELHERAIALFAAGQPSGQTGSRAARNGHSPNALHTE
jgi:hypothetical protein